MKVMKKSFFYTICLTIILLSFGISLYFFPFLPERMASHWGVNGEVNGWMPKNVGAFFMPILSIALFFVFLFVPKMDPKWKNIKIFENYFDGFITVFFLFLFYIHILTLLWNLNLRFNLIQFLSPAFGILFFSVGILLKHTLPNYTIGFRTPWAIENEIVWKKTHTLGGRLFKIAGALCMFGILLPELAIWFIIVPVIGFSIGTMVYSYVEYLKIK
jgi:uncharacterized membrane protein